MNYTVGFIPWLLLGLMLQLCRCMTVPTPIVASCNPELRDMLQKFPLGEFFRSGTQHLLFLAERNSQILYRISIYYSAGSDSNQTFWSFSTDQFQNLGRSFLENSCERKLFQAVANADIKNITETGFTIASYGRKMQEREALRLAAATCNLQNGVSVAAQHSDVVIPNSNLTAYKDKSRGNTSSVVVTDLILVVEIVTKYDGTVKSLMNGKFVPPYWEPALTLVFLVNFFHDQLLLVIAHQIIQYDCHQGNIFIQVDPKTSRISFVIGDMGYSGVYHVRDGMDSIGQTCSSGVKNQNGFKHHQTPMYKEASQKLLDCINESVILRNSSAHQVAVIAAEIYDRHQSLINEDLSTEQFFQQMLQYTFERIHATIPFGALRNEFHASLSDVMSVELGYMYQLISEQREEVVRVKESNLALNASNIASNIALHDLRSRLERLEKLVANK
jgi:hypothetical protein